MVVCPADPDERALVPVLRSLASLGFGILAPAGYAGRLSRGGVRCASLDGQPAGQVIHEDVSLVISTAERCEFRAVATATGRPCVTTVRAAAALAEGLCEAAQRDPNALSLQAWQARQKAPDTTADGGPAC